jgi:hypothetical protein
MPEHLIAGKSIIDSSTRDCNETDSCGEGCLDCRWNRRKSKVLQRSHYVSHIGLRGVGAFKQNSIPSSPMMRCATCSSGTVNEHSALNVVLYRGGEGRATNPLHNTPQTTLNVSNCTQLRYRECLPSSCHSELGSVRCLV